MKQSSATRLSCLFRVFALIITMQVGFVTYAQENTSYSILVAGHAYGAHAGTNLGLHPPFLKKLQEEKDPAIAGLFLTGDIVNTSTAASWAQVEKELSELGLHSYYIMGNHDSNTIGKAEFIKKYGGSFYSFLLHDDLYIILNSTSSGRSISAEQLTFLVNTLQNVITANKRVFIFFHEVLWNSHDKYRLVRSNSRSRYDEIRSVSNFWQKVVPIMDTYPEKNFYLFSGDVGGNPDAISAFYDRWGHMTLLSSGMGEVPDENYMKVNISTDTVTYEIIPLSNSIQIQPVTWYSIPETPQKITGPVVVNPSEGVVSYEVSPVNNASSYKWSYSYGITGSSNTTVASLTFDTQYQTGQISVKAVKDGFGESDPVTLKVNASDYTSVSDMERTSPLKILQNGQYIHISYLSGKSSMAQIKIYDLTGKLLWYKMSFLKNGSNAATIDKKLLGTGVVIVDCIMDNKHLNKKIVLY